ncbi:MAG: hypothetical protein ACI9JD_004443, partial [Rhodococcus sp. (in: high G+C Gram-positive bacteria)]
MWGLLDRARGSVSLLQREVRIRLQFTDFGLQDPHR